MAAAAQYAAFRAPDGGDGLTAIREELRMLTGATDGDLLFAGLFLWSKIRTRTLAGIDVNGAPFAPYSTKGPYYFYPNAGVGSVRGRLAPSDKGLLGEVQHARKTAAANRHRAIGGAGTRTPYGIKYASYAAAKAGHGVANVNLFGMEQHTHMLNTAMIKASGFEMPAVEQFDFGSDLAAHEAGSIAASPQLMIGFYGPEAERAKGNNEGIPGKLPKREFFALNQAELDACAAAVGRRMELRATEARLHG